jgi:hypothetical protein
VITKSLWNGGRGVNLRSKRVQITEAGRHTLAAGVERGKSRRDGHGGAIMVPVRRRGRVVLSISVVVVAVGGEASAAAGVAVDGAEELVDGLAVHVVDGGGAEGGAYERRDGEVECVRGGVHGAAAALPGGAAAAAGVWAWAQMKTDTSEHSQWHLRIIYPSFLVSLSLSSILVMQKNK